MANSMLSPLLLAHGKPHGCQLKPHGLPTHANLFCLPFTMWVGHPSMWLPTQFGLISYTFSIISSIITTITIIFLGFFALSVLSIGYSIQTRRKTMSQIPTQVDHHIQANNPPPESDHHHTTDYAPYPKLDPTDIAPPAADVWTSVPVSAPPAAEHPPTNPRVSSPEGPAPIAGQSATTMPPESNPYVAPSPVPASSIKNTMDSVKGVLGKWGKKAAEATKKAEDLAGNMWQHLKTGPSFADAAVGRIAQGTKVFAEGGYEKVFRQTFETVPEEQLLKPYACYLSTSAGPVMGVLYLSSAKLAFCSDNPLSYNVGDQTQWSYYKVVIPLHQLKAVNPSTSKVNTAEKYIQIISVDNHEFWFMGFVNYDSAVKKLKGMLEGHSS